MPLIAIYNPVCGHGTARAFFDDHVLPLLAQHGHTVDKLVETERADHAGEILVDFLESTSGEITIVLGSGDGTLHEIVNHLSRTVFKGSRAGGLRSRLLFVLVPCGTANALFSSLFPPKDDPAAYTDTAYRCQSVQSFIDSRSPIPLRVAIGTLSSPPNVKKQPQFTVSTVVMSTSLHASILHDSESLRSEIPGMER